MAWTLRLQGVGNAFAGAALGSAMATIQRDGAPWLSIDCGNEGLTTYLEQYGEPPLALFVTHTHLDHVSGFERLFVANWFDTTRRGRIRIYVPAPVVPLLHQRVGAYPNALAEGGVNFWDAFHVIPVGDHFWHDGVRLEVFPARHHAPGSAFGLRLHGSLVWTGDTRPIPEMLAQYADAGELVAHDCALQGNPSHSGIDDLEREYPRELLDRMLIYHYASVADGDAMAARGYRVLRQGEEIPLNEPSAQRAEQPGVTSDITESP